jgi:hypothetical protein
MPADGTVTVEHVRLKRAQADAAVARQRLSYLFSSVLLGPPSMAPSAVLVVRSMSDPLPGRITKDFASAAIPGTDWQSAAQTQLGALYRRAARPAAGPVPASAEAVLFADYSELLACLALDSVTNSAYVWWWKSILRNTVLGLPGAWADAWAKHPLYVPSALQQLDEQGKAVQILRAIAPLQAWRLLVAVGRAFDLPEYAFQLTEWTATHSNPGTVSRVSPAFESRSFEPQSKDANDPAGTTPEEVRSDEESRSKDAGSDVRRPWSRAHQPPWEPAVPAASSLIELGWERRALHGVSLLLCHAPHRALRAAFARELHEWIALERDNSNGRPDAPQSNVAAEPSLRTPPFHETSGSQAMPSSLASGSESADPAGSGSPSARAENPVSDHHPSSSTTTDALETAASTPLPPCDAPPAPPDARSISDSPKKKSSRQLQLQFENGCPTRLGGIFYLIHLLYRSSLFDFEIGLGGWALLEVLARCLLDRLSIDTSNDPVWAALALLDGRDPGADPAEAFQPQMIYEAPDSWLRNLGSPLRSIRFRSGRVELWHPEGFCTFDSQDPVSLDRAWVSQFPRLNRAQRRSLIPETRVCPVGLNPSPQLRRFLHFILPFARWRLRKALGDTSIEEILLRDGTLYASRTHVDLVMGLKQVNVPARLAGLDKNPGWVLELGRVVIFHFVQEGRGDE